MKFTFICEEEGTRVEHTTEVGHAWFPALYHFQTFLLGCGYVIDHDMKFNLVQGCPGDNYTAKGVDEVTYQGNQDE